jgi:hypothetical protein
MTHLISRWDFTLPVLRMGGQQEFPLQIFYRKSKMKKNSAQYLAISIFFIVCALVLVGCSASGEEIRAVPTQVGAYTVDPLFSEFYQMLGGESVLGPIISRPFTDGTRRFQYVQSGCLEFNSELPSSQSYRLSPLGLELGISDPPVPQPDEQNILYVNGHVIPGDFKLMYEKMGGARFVGKPLTEVHYNESKKRYEQYFENVAFYFSTNEAVNKVKLMAYGAWKCDVYCRLAPPEAAVVDLPAIGVSIAESPFREAVSRLGPEFTGFPLTNAYLTHDGFIVQIFENIVLLANSDTPNRVSALPLTEKLGILPEPPTLPKDTLENIFVPVDGTLGYNVPRLFVDYIAMHGGMEISGSPVSELSFVSDGVYRQCFQNLCLKYYYRDNAGSNRQIRPQALGYLYRDLNYHPSVVGFSESQAIKIINMHVWERYPIISAKQSQEIAVAVFEGTTPLFNIEPLLQITLPDGTSKSIYFPPTGPDGQTFLQLEPVRGQNGTLVPYQVCISSVTNETFCIKESFLIWE